MPVNLRRALSTTSRSGTARTLILAVPLVLLVIAAAGLGGTSHFTGARWFPRGHNNSSVAPPHSKVNLQSPPKLQTGSGGSGHIPGWIPIVLGVIVALLIAAYIFRLIRRRRLPSAPTVHAAPVQAVTAQPAPEPEPEPERLLTGIETALRALDEQRDPADAVVQAWLGLQATAEESGILRGAAETPTEFTSRILGSAFADDQAIRTLLRLYLRTRFGDHPVTQSDVTAVRTALQQLVSNWQVATG